MTAGFHGRTALVTGGRGGIGGAFARELAQRGCRVAITSRTPGEAGARLDEIAHASPPGVPPPIAVGWDMGVAGAESAALHALKEAGISVEIFVHAAHVFSAHELILGTKPVDFARSLERNVVAPYALARGLCRVMSRAGFGRVLFVSSLVASLGGEGQVTYIAEKSALEGLVRAFAAEFGRRGISVNAVAPGIVDTPHVRRAVRPEVIAAFEKQTLSGRLIAPEEVARASIDLLDPSEGCVTGQILRVDGRSHG
jgi:NAD(P)-dependent dehydrogenase (short-subunit alcohol dehydrogenase family)